MIDHKGEGSFCSICDFEFKFKFKLRLGIDTIFVFIVTLVKLEETAQYLKHNTKEINHEGQKNWELI